MPWFVDIDEQGVPDFRVIRPGGMGIAVRYNLCWVCGQPRDLWNSFLIGPMCVVNRVSPEPPSHRECVVYSARACPFLTTPTMRRRDRHLPDTLIETPGTPLLHNPGVSVVWVSRRWEPFRVDNGVLFDIGEPMQIQWFAEGRTATPAEVQAAFDKGLPALERELEPGDDSGRLLLDRQIAVARTLLPTT